MKNKKIIFIVLIVIVIILTCLFLKNDILNQKYEILLLGSKNETEENSDNQYEVNIKNPKNITINLFNTLTSEMNLDDKVAPGSGGEFFIVINGYDMQEDVNYCVQFISKNQKPQNLVFKIKGEDETFDCVEDIGKRLSGILEKNSKKIIPIYWEWKYETGEEENIQDTQDGKNIKEYNFEVIIDVVD
jgi:uncharacterized membrane protein